MSGFVGQSLGQYQIVEELARGGMAVIYKAYQPSLDRYVAIKVLPAFFARTPGYLERFRREAKAMARLSHPHVVEVLDYGQQDDTTYLVMALVGGGSLRDRLGQPLPLDTILDWMEQIGSGLADGADRQRLGLCTRARSGASRYQTGQHPVHQRWPRHAE
jgi:serine/threonine protein kinase